MVILYRSICKTISVMHNAVCASNEAQTASTWSSLAFFCAPLPWAKSMRSAELYSGSCRGSLLFCKVLDKHSVIDLALRRKINDKSIM